MRTIFITGGAGFVGSSFVRVVLAETDCGDRQLRCADLLRKPREPGGNRSNDRYRFVRGDIADAQAVANALEPGTDAIVNFAAESHVDRSIASADDFLRTNVIGTQTFSTRRGKKACAGLCRFD